MSELFQLELMLYGFIADNVGNVGWSNVYPNEINFPPNFLFSLSPPDA